jgi:hypothetical protein
MTGTRTTARQALDRLVDALVEDILNMSDEEILAEFREDHGDPERHVAEMRALVEKSVAIANERRADPRFDRVVVDTWPERVRTAVERVQVLLEQHPGDVYYRLCLQGWEQELARIEKAQQGETKP